MYPWLNILNNKKQADTTDVFIYGEIRDDKWSDTDVSPSDFKELQNIKAKNINVYLNSPGGEVYAGVAIGSILKRHEAKINMVVDGMAGSIAATILMAGDKRSIVNNGMVFMHNPLTITMGYASDFRKTADNLDKAKEALLTEFVDKTGQTKEAISKIMDEETFLTAQEALNLGFVTEIIKDKNATGTIDNKKIVVNGVEFDLKNRFKNFNPESITLKEKVIEEPDNSSIKQVILENQYYLNTMEVL